MTTSIWKLNGYNIYVDQFSQQGQGEVVELNPLNSTASIYHKIFDADEEVQFQGTVIGETNEAAMRATHLTEVTLISDLAPSGYTVLVMNVQTTRTPSMSQHVDGSQAVDAPVYRAVFTAKVV